MSSMRCGYGHLVSRCEPDRRLRAKCLMDFGYQLPLARLTARTGGVRTELWRQFRYIGTKNLCATYKLYCGWELFKRGIYYITACTWGLIDGPKSLGLVIWSWCDGICDVGINLFSGRAHATPDCLVPVVWSQCDVIGGVLICSICTHIWF